MRHNVGLFD